MTAFFTSSVYHITFHGIYESFEGVILKHSSLALKWPSEIPGSLIRLHVSLHNHCLSYRYQTRWAFYTAGKPLERTTWSLLFVTLCCVSRTIATFAVISPLYVLPLNSPQTRHYGDIHTITSDYISGLRSIHWAQILCPAGLSTWVSGSLLFFFLFIILFSRSLACSKA